MNNNIVIINGGAGSGNPNPKRDKYGRFACEGKSKFFDSWNDAPEFKLEENELHQYIDDIEELRKQAKKYYQTNFQGNPIYREELGNIRVSGKGLDEYFHFAADTDKLLAVPIIPKLIKEGKLGEFEEDYKNRNDGIVGFYPIYANLKTLNGNRKAELLIAKDREGRLFYQMFLDFDRDKAREKALKKEATAGTNPPASNNIINDVNNNFKSNVKENKQMNTQEIKEQLKSIFRQVINNGKDINVENGFITLDGGTPEERVIWVPFEVFSKKAAEKVREIADNYKEGDETKYDFSHTRVKLSEDQVNYIKNTVKDIQNKYKFKGIAEINISAEFNKGSLGVCASPDNCSVVSLSPQLYNGKHNQERWNKGVESGFHPKGTGEMVKSVLVHELGHAITCNSQNTKFWSEIEKIRGEYLKEVKKKDISHPDFISGYARTNKYEFVAEAFCQGTLAKNYGKYTKQVMATIDKHFKSEYQTKLFNAKDDKENEDNFWVEEYGLGYPIDEEAFEEFNKEQNKKENNNKADNSKEQDMAILEELKKLITKVENDKGEDMDDKEIKEVENEKVDKRKLIDEVGGILKGKVDDEIIRTIIGKLEKVAYDESEAGTADNEDDDKKEDAKNCKKVKNEDAEDKEKAEEIKEEVKEDVENKCKNSVDNAKTDYFAKLNEIYNASKAVKEAPTYVSRAEREQLANDYFAK